VHARRDRPEDPSQKRIELARTTAQETQAQVAEQAYLRAR